MWQAGFHMTCKLGIGNRFKDMSDDPVSQRLDVGAMRRAAKLFLGKHDFKSFEGTRDYEVESRVRTLTRCDVKRNGPLLTFIIEGDGFLYKMCRGIVGTLVQVGQRKFAAEDIKLMLARKDRRVAGMTAPPHGLVLWKVYYGKVPRANAQSTQKFQGPNAK